MGEIMNKAIEAVSTIPYQETRRRQIENKTLDHKVNNETGYDEVKEEMIDSNIIYDRFEEKLFDRNVDERMEYYFGTKVPPKHIEICGKYIYEYRYERY